VVRDNASNRPLVAKARLQLCSLYQNTDPAKARQHCEQAAGMTDQGPIAAEAKARLDALPADANSPLRIFTPFTEDPFAFAIAPDGRSLVFQATVDGKSHLWLQPLDPKREPAPIAGTENAKDSAFPFFSPDGRSIGFFAEGKLKRVDTGGGVALVLADAPRPAGGT
jgi:hypothetical protein